MSQDDSRMTILYFALSALDLLEGLDAVLTTPEKKQDIIDWIYSLQILPNPDGSSNRCGFRGSPVMGNVFDCCHNNPVDMDKEFPHSTAHLAMTYVALCNLRVLGDDWGKVNREAIISAMRLHQQADGSYSPTHLGGESDMRFLYCACAISHMLGDWRGVDKEAAARFITSSQSYDGGIGMGPGSEGHGGSTYTAVAALTLMGKLDAIDTDALIKWCVRSQGQGYKGRPNKPEDVCYSFWIGATLKMLGGYGFTNPAGNREFSMKCQYKYGGFGKLPGALPDILHSYYGVAGLSLGGMDDLPPLNCTLGQTVKTAGEEGSYAPDRAALNPSSD